MHTNRPGCDDAADRSRGAERVCGGACGLGRRRQRLRLDRHVETGIGVRFGPSPCTITRKCLPTAQWNQRGTGQHRPRRWKTITTAVLAPQTTTTGRRPPSTVDARQARPGRFVAWPWSASALLRPGEVLLPRARPRRIADRFPGVHRFLWHKWYFDNSARHRPPGLAVSQWCAAFDRNVVTASSTPSAAEPSRSPRSAAKPTATSSMAW